MIYSVSNVVKTPRGKLSATLLEDGIAIAKISRPANAGGWIQEKTVKFFTAGARSRFIDFCDCITVEEGTEALGA